MVNLLTDYASHGKLDSRGQIPIVSGKDNLIQSIKNALKTYKGTYSYIDADYGSLLKDYISMDNNEVTRQLICLEIETVALKDSRVASAICEYDNGEYKLHGKTTDGEDFADEGLFV